MSADRRGDGTVVIGLGSPLMGDDGLGLRALEALRERWRFSPHVELLDGGTWGMNLLPFIEAAERVLVLDAIDAGADPGSLVRLEDDGLPRFLSTKVSPHQIDLREVLALSDLRGTLPRLVALGLQPAEIEMRTELSAVVEDGLPGLLSEAVQCLAAWGHEAAPALPDDPGPGRPTPPAVGTLPDGDGSAEPDAAPCTR